MQSSSPKATISDLAGLKNEAQAPDKNLRPKPIVPALHIEAFLLLGNGRHPTSWTTFTVAIGAWLSPPKQTEGSPL